MALLRHLGSCWRAQLQAAATGTPFRARGIRRSAGGQRNPIEQVAEGAGTEVLLKPHPLGNGGSVALPGGEDS